MMANLPLANLYCILVCFAAVQVPAQDPFASIRYQMAWRVLPELGIRDERILRAMATVPRHEFVPPEYRHLAYQDMALPIGHGQTISPPFVVAYMTQVIDPQPTDKVLEIGTGSGYQAAVLSGLVREVYTIEIVEPLARRAARTLARLGYANVHVKAGDGFLGWPEAAPFDKIIVTCSPESIPQPLIEQLKEGGRMVIPVGQRYQQVMYLLKKQNGKLVREALRPTLFVPMTGKAEQLRRVKPDPTNPTIENGDFEDLLEDNTPSAWYYQRQLTVRSAGAPSGEKYIELSNTQPGRPAQAVQGFGVDGSVVRRLQVSYMVKYSNLRSGTARYQKAAMVIVFFDSERKPIHTAEVAAWTGTRDWHRETKIVSVPTNAKEAILIIGLSGATGRLCFDDIQLQGIAKDKPAD